MKYRAPSPPACRDRPLSQHEVRRQIDKMLKHDFKLDVASLIAKDIGYMTEEFVPARLAAQDWLD